jgi:hypothetical protein
VPVWEESKLEVAELDTLGFADLQRAFAGAYVRPDLVGAEQVKSSWGRATLAIEGAGRCEFIPNDVLR